MAVRILEVDEVVVVGGCSCGVSTFQRLEHLPEVLMVAERRVDGDGSAQHGSGDEDLDVRSPHSLAINPALVDVVRLRYGRVQAVAFTSKLVHNQLPHLPQRPITDNT